MYVRLLVIITITVFKRYHNTANIRNVCFCKEKKWYLCDRPIVNYRL